MSDPPISTMSVTDGLAVGGGVSHTSAGASTSTVEEIVQRASSPDSTKESTPKIERNEHPPSTTRNIVEPAMVEAHVAQALKQ